MLLCDEVDKVAGRVVCLLGWVAFPVVWLIVDGLVPVVWVGGPMVAGGEPGAALGPIVVSVAGASV